MTTKTTAFSTGARMGAALTLFALFVLPSGAAAQTNGVTAPIGQLPRSPVAPYVAPSAWRLDTPHAALWLWLLWRARALCKQLR